MFQVLILIFLYTCFLYDPRRDDHEEPMNNYYINDNKRIEPGSAFRLNLSRTSSDESNSSSSGGRRRNISYQPVILGGDEEISTSDDAALLQNY